jgi:hypothetical protein
MTTIIDHTEPLPEKKVARILLHLMSAILCLGIATAVVVIVEAAQEEITLPKGAALPAPRVPETRIVGEMR